MQFRNKVVKFEALLSFSTFLFCYLRILIISSVNRGRVMKSDNLMIPFAFSLLFIQRKSPKTRELDIMQRSLVSPRQEDQANPRRSN